MNDTAVMVLRLAGAPTQAWNSNPHAVTPGSPTWVRGGPNGEPQESVAPSKPNLVGLLGAGLGRRRGKPVGVGQRGQAYLDDLEQLRYIVRVDLEGHSRLEFSTRPGFTSTGDPVSRPKAETVVDDCAYIVGVSGPRALIENAWDALAHPAFNLYYGKRAYPICLPLRLELITDPSADVQNVIREWPWIAPAWARAQLATTISLRLYEPREPRVTRGGRLRQSPPRCDGFTHDELPPRTLHNPDGNPNLDPIDWLDAITHPGEVHNVT